MRKQHQCHCSSSRSIPADPPQTCAQKFSSGCVTRSQRARKQGQERGLQGPGLLQRGLGARGGCCSQPGTAPGRGTAPGHGTAPECGTAQRGTAQHIMAQPCHGRSSAAMLNADTDVAPRGGQVWEWGHRLHPPAPRLAQARIEGDAHRGWHSLDPRSTNTLPPPLAHPPSAPPVPTAAPRTGSPKTPQGRGGARGAPSCLPHPSGSRGHRGGSALPLPGGFPSLQHCCRCSPGMLSPGASASQSLRGLWADRSQGGGRPLLPHQPGTPGSCSGA